MAKKGSPSVTFDSNILDGDDCLQSVTLTHNANDLTYLCDGYVKHEAGAETITLQFSVAVENDDTTLISNFAVGSTGTAEFHPFGDTAGNIEYTTTNATIMSCAPGAVSPDGIVIYDISMMWDDVTAGAAAS